MREAPHFRTFPEYVEFLKARNHNFTRLWTFDHYQFESTPSPWARTGPGTALDGQAKWDVTIVNPEFLDRLRNRVVQFRANGIYVSVMFFRGISRARSPPLQLGRAPVQSGQQCQCGTGRSDLDAYNDLTHPAALALQKHYIGSVIDTLNDLDNVIWEIANEANLGVTRGSNIWSITFGATKPPSRGNIWWGSPARIRMTIPACSVQPPTGSLPGSPITTRTIRRLPPGDKSSCRTPIITCSQTRTRRGYGSRSLAASIRS